MAIAPGMGLGPRRPDAIEPTARSTNVLGKALELPVWLLLTRPTTGGDTVHTYHSTKKWLCKGGSGQFADDWKSAPMLVCT